MNDNFYNLLIQQICGICGQAVEHGSPAYAIQIHGNVYMCHDDCVSEAAEELRYTKYFQCPNNCGKLTIRDHFDGQRSELDCPKCHFSGRL